MDKTNLIKQFDKLQNKYGSKHYNSVYGGGQESEPNLCLVFVNPTARNIATNKNWTGIKCQWLGTKQVWKFLTNAGLFDCKLNDKIQKMNASEWTPDFCKEVYDEVAKNGLYITNLAKCTQDDARPLSDSVLKQYKALFLNEMELVNPKKIILFGNQVSSIVLNKKISVSEYRKICVPLTIGKKNYRCFLFIIQLETVFLTHPKQ